METTVPYSALLGTLVLDGLGDPDVSRRGTSVVVKPEALGLRANRVLFVALLGQPRR